MSGIAPISGKTTRAEPRPFDRHGKLSSGSGLCRRSLSSRQRHAGSGDLLSTNLRPRSFGLGPGLSSLPREGSELTTTFKTTAIFLQPFELPSFNETLPAGEYEIETELVEPLGRMEPGTWASSVQVRLQPRASHPGLSRILTVPLAELERAVAKDKLTGKPLADFFLEEMLADPMIRLVMKADGVAESEVRETYADRSEAGTESDSFDTAPTAAPASPDEGGPDVTGPRQGASRTPNGGDRGV